MNTQLPNQKQIKAIVKVSNNYSFGNVNLFRLGENCKYPNMHIDKFGLWKPNVKFRKRETV
jgi:hypothetical protein